MGNGEESDFAKSQDSSQQAGGPSANASQKRGSLAAHSGRSEPKCLSESTIIKNEHRVGNCLSLLHPSWTVVLVPVS